MQDKELRKIPNRKSTKMITAENNAEKLFYLMRSCSLLCYQKSLLPATTFATRKQLLLVDLKEKNLIKIFFL